MVVYGKSSIKSFETAKEKNDRKLMIFFQDDNKTMRDMCPQNDTWTPVII